MVQAPVGFHCPECVAANRPPRIPASYSSSGLTMTKAIIGICVGIFVLANVLGMPGLDAGRLGMIPGAIGVNHEWYRLLTAAFLHGGWMHIGFNMYALYYLGIGIERFLGQRRFLILYVLSALGGSAVSYFFSPIDTVAVGASGAIFGLMAATWVLGDQLRIDKSQILVLFVVNMLLGFSSPGIDWRAHVGGAIAGGLVASGMSRRGGFVLIIGTALAIVALVVVRDAAVASYFMG
jgi:membrane associated rhomboid family serine protease